MSTIIIPYIYNTYNTVVHIYIVVNLISILYFFSNYFISCLNPAYSCDLGLICCAST